MFSPDRPFVHHPCAERIDTISPGPPHEHFASRSRMSPVAGKRPPCRARCSTSAARPMGAGLRRDLRQPAPGNGGGGLRMAEPTPAGPSQRGGGGGGGVRGPGRRPHGRRRRPPGRAPRAHAHTRNMFTRHRCGRKPKVNRQTAISARCGVCLLTCVSGEEPATSVRQWYLPLTIAAMTPHRI